MQGHELLNELIRIAKNISDEYLRRIVLDVLTNPKSKVLRVENLVDMEDSPAAPRKHHAYTSGLLQHTLSVTRISMELCKIFREMYGIELNIDLVVATAILHDIYKFYQYERDEVAGGYRPRSDWYMSHDYAIVAELAARGAPDTLLRCISEVHGRVPITMAECLVVHLADSTDASFNEYLQNLILSLAKDIETMNPSIKSIDLLEKSSRIGIGRVISCIRGLRRSEALKRFAELLGIEIACQESR